MLLCEGEKFKERLISEEIGKNVVYVMVEGVPHGWDKAPNPIKPTPGVKEHYLRACKELRRVFRQVDQRGVDGFGAGVGGQVGRDHGGASAANGGPVGGESSNSSGSWDVADDGESIDGLHKKGRRESRLVN